MLRCETNTTKMMDEIMDAATTSPNISQLHHNLSAFFEHGQWFISCLDCGAQWSVNDCEKDGVAYFGFEEISHGDESCLEEKEDSCIAGMACPECGNNLSFTIEAKKQFIITAEGTEDPGSDAHWDGKSYCRCNNCDHDGIVADFYTDPAMRVQETAGEEKNQAATTFIRTPERPNMIGPISDAQLAQILAALRYWQANHNLKIKETLDALKENWEHFEDDGCDPLNDDQINDLCELINLGPIPPANYIPAIRADLVEKLLDAFEGDIFTDAPEYEVCVRNALVLRDRLREILTHGKDRPEEIDRLFSELVSLEEEGKLPILSPKLPTKHGK